MRVLSLSLCCVCLFLLAMTFMTHSHIKQSLTDWLTSNYEKNNWNVKYHAYSGCSMMYCDCVNRASFSL